MVLVNPDSSPPPPQFPEHPFTDIPGLTANPNLKPVRRLKLYLPLLLLLAFLPVVTGAVLIRQYLSGSAKNSSAACRQQITSVHINPAALNTFYPGPKTRLSALAYDEKEKPIWKNVTYEWGMSSVESVGNLIPDGLLATFIPLHTGRGNIFVTGSFCGLKAKGSVPVVVSPAPPSTPTPTPRHPRQK